MSTRMKIAALALASTSILFTQIASADLDSMKSFVGAYALDTVASQHADECRLNLSIHLGSAGDIKYVGEYPSAPKETGAIIYSTRPDSAWLEDFVSEQALTYGYDSETTGPLSDPRIVESRPTWLSKSTLLHRVKINESADTAGPPVGRQVLNIARTYRLNGKTLTLTTQASRTIYPYYGTPIYQESANICTYQQISPIPAHLKR